MGDASVGATSLTRIPTGWDDEVRLPKITLCIPAGGRLF